MHMHAFSPMEIIYGRADGMSFGDYLGMLSEAGLGTIPGTAAEILDDEVREVLSHKKSTSHWIEIITTAHSSAFRSTSTLMYGHVETPEPRRRHICSCSATSRARPADSPSSCRYASSTPIPKCIAMGS